MRSHDVPSPDSIAPASLDLDRDQTVVMRMTFPEPRARISKGTVAIALSLVAFVCTFIGAGWSAATHAPVARAAAGSGPAPTLDAPVVVDIRSEPGVVTVPVIELSAPLAAAPARHRASVRAPGPTAAPVKKPVALLAVDAGLPTPAPEPPRASPRPAPKAPGDAASIRDLNATASAVLESSL